VRVGPFVLGDTVNAVLRDLIANPQLYGRIVITYSGLVSVVETVRTASSADGGGWAEDPRCARDH
jgi:hypothetical protein